MDNTVAEEYHGCANMNLVSKSLESSIKIDSISIDLINTNEKSDAGNCDHFSIRGYVSEIRKKNGKMCWPFSSDDDSSKYDEVACKLPSLHVPKFRYWRCHECLREIGAKGTGNDGPIFTPCISGFKPKSICSHASVIDDVARLVSDLQQAPHLDIIKEKAICGDSNAANLNNMTGVSKNKSEEAHGPIKGCNSGDILNQEKHKLGTTISIQKQKPNFTDDRKSKSNESVDFIKPGRGKGVVDVEPVTNINCMDMSSKIHEIRKVNPVDDHPKELIACGMSAEVGNIEAYSVGMGSGHPSLVLDDLGCDLSESAEIMAANIVRDHDNSSGLHRRKTRKVRLLTELLCENDCADNIQSNAIRGSSDERDKLPIPQSHVAAQGNFRRGLAQPKKRKSDRDEDWKPTQTGSPNKVGKEVRLLKRDVESPDAIAQAFARMQLQTGRKNNCFKRGIDRSPSLCKKKNKKTLIFEESSSLVPAQENVPNKLWNETGDASNSNAADRLFSKPLHNAVTREEADSFHFSTQRVGRKPSFKKKAKMPQDDTQQSPSIIQKHDKLREDPMSRKVVEFQQSRPVRVPLHTARDIFSENGPDLSLKNYITTERNDMLRNPQLVDGQTCFSTRKEGTAREAQVKSNFTEVEHLGNFNFASKSVTELAFGKGVYNELNGNRTPIKMPLHKEKQNYASQAEISGCSHMQKKNHCGTSSKNTTIKTQVHPVLTRKDNDPRAKNVSEQVISDDIPMEIVELMAKNQYERCLPDAEFGRCQLEVTNNTRTMDFSKAYGNGELDFSQKEANEKHNSHAKNGRNGIANRGENVGPAKQKSSDLVNQSHLDQYFISQLEHTPIPKVFEALFQPHHKPSSGIQHYPSNSGRQNSAENHKWIGDSGGNRSSDNCLQTSGPCNACQGVQQHSKETHQIWSSVMPNHMPGYDVAQRSLLPFTSMDILSDSASNMNKEYISGHRDLKFLNQNPSSFGKQNRNLVSDSFRICTEPVSCKRSGVNLSQKPVRSFDLYSNETIPAMHLLSLMDAGLQSSAPVNLDATPKFLKRTVTCDQDHNEFRRPESAVYKVTNSMKHTPFHSHGKKQAVAGPSMASFAYDKSFQRATDFTSQVSREKGKGKGSDSRTQSSGYKPPKPSSQNRNFATNCGSNPVHSMQTMFFGVSDSMAIPSQLRGMENSIKHKMEVNNDTRPVRPNKSSPDGICSVNRNPADFSIPEPGNLFMISGEDLKFGKTVPFSAELVGQKRPKKLPAVKEQRRRLIS
ncbi:protein EMBRYONIC FLOWER 1 isoform X2 [Mercurialis annua]|uniref:protein EMBRYONIC FLOWER 1 isoform X2 n=1 Tax=Mercurialis annua TaxID=3986 RepID=UPI00215F1DF0|nr:protein EMBRYONIC FLOWER 1 isoform X2 [Mercurialis annua]